MDIVMRNAAAESVDDIRPDARPIEAMEADRFIHVRRPDGFVTTRQRRIRMVKFVHPTDANKLCTALKDMGPPTGEPDIFIPCDGEVEMAHVHELLDSAAERRRERVRLAALLLPERTAFFRKSLLEIGLEGIARKQGISTFGPGGFTQRESPNGN